MMKMELLTAAQRELAEDLTDLMEDATVNDAFAALISIIAATCNGTFDGGVESRSQAASFANRLVATVEAGQHGQLRMDGEVLQ